MHRLWIGCALGLALIGSGQSAKAGTYQREADTGTSTPQTDNGTSGVGGTIQSAVSYSTNSFTGTGSTANTNLTTPAQTATSTLIAKWTFVPDPTYAYYGMVDQPKPLYTRRNGYYSWNLSSQVRPDPGSAPTSYPYADAIAEFNVDGVKDSKTASAETNMPGASSATTSLAPSDQSYTGSCTRTAIASVTSRTAMSMPTGSSGMLSANSGTSLSSPEANYTYLAFSESTSPF